MSRLISKRKYSRESPSREAKKIFIICEGTKREPQYFSFFKELDSRINIIIHTLSDQEDNSPGGLYRIARNVLLSEDGQTNSSVQLLANDEVWIVFDSDPDKLNSRARQIADLKAGCLEFGWYAAQSNPCFEVWLFSHFGEQVPHLAEVHRCSEWKRHLNDTIAGGFDPRKHPALIGQAIGRARDLYREVEGQPATGSTQLFLLGESIYHLVKDKI
jgi:hypothetical protein